MAGQVIEDAVLKRLFFALWPDPDTRRQCFDVVRRVKAYGRPVQASNLHLTLVFLGATAEDQEKALIAAANRIRFNPMRLSFDRVSHWRKPAVCCMTSSTTDDAMTSLVMQLRQIVVAENIAIDARAFRPHITLLRKCSTAPPPLSIQPILWRSQAFCLVESCSTPSGVNYRVLQQWTAH